MSTRFSRRSVLRTAGVVLAGAIAGCSGGDETTPDDDNNSDGASEPETETKTETATTTPTATATPTDDTGDNEDSPSVEEFLSDTSNFDSVEDKTGMDTVEVRVGAEGNNAFFAFAPAAIRVDTGTTVTWTWTGQGGSHNVAAEHGAEFDSELKNDEGATFEQTFSEAGTVLYACDPHKGAGMKGAVVVE